MKAKKVVELFCGAGGMSLGFQQAGFEIVGAYDCWDAASRVYEKNLGRAPTLMDLKDVFAAATAIRSLGIDVLTGGPPCQDFSSAGSRVEGENAAMLIAFAMIAVIVRPPWIVIENVIQTLGSQAWVEARKILMEAGYGISISKVNAAHYGVPQNRRRVIVVCRLGEADGFMETAVAQAAAQKPMTLREMLEDAPDHIYSHPRNAGKRCVFSADEPQPTTRSTWRRPVPRRFFEEDKALLANGNFFTRPFNNGRGVRSIDDQVPAIVRTSRERPRPRYLAKPHRLDPVHPSRAAVLTQRQISRVQGFPEAWDWSVAGTLRDIDQMIANAVPPPLARVIGDLIMERECGGLPPVPGDFLAWLRRVMKLTEKAAQNTLATLDQARRFLGGRIFADHRIELHTLETTPEFAVLDTAARSKLRKALRLHQDWRSTGRSRNKQPMHRLPERGGVREFFRRVGRGLGSPWTAKRTKGHGAPSPVIGLQADIARTVTEEKGSASIYLEPGGRLSPTASKSPPGAGDILSHPICLPTRPEPPEIMAPDALPAASDATPEIRGKNGSAPDNSDFGLKARLPLAAIAHLITIGANHRIFQMATSTTVISKPETVSRPPPS